MFQYEKEKVEAYLKLSELLVKMQSGKNKDLIESFGFFYNESKFGPNCSHTKKTYLLLEKNPDIKNIFAAIKELSNDL